MSVTSITSYKRQLKLRGVGRVLRRTIHTGFMIGFALSVVVGILWTFGNILATVGGLVGLPESTVRWIGALAMLAWLGYCAWLLNKHREWFQHTRYEGGA